MESEETGELTTRQRQWIEDSWKPFAQELDEALNCRSDRDRERGNDGKLEDDR
jgi:hypothetical protein